MGRTDAEIQRDLDLWERELDLHLTHCDTCREDVERYCRAGSEISYMVTSLMMEKLRARPDGSSQSQVYEPQMNTDERG